MRKVIFTPDTAGVSIPGLPDSTVVVVHEMYDAPQNIAGRIVPWQKFKSAYPEYVADQFVIVGLNRIITPANRCQMVNDYLYSMTKSIQKISIDTAPFLGEPWRLWYHYGLAFGEWLGVDYSYPVEGDWQRWFYYDANDSKLSAENLPLYIRDTETTLPPLASTFDLYAPDDEDGEFYAHAKAAAFEKHATPKMIIAELLKLCNRHFQADCGFDSYRENRTFHLPDVGVYRFVAEENRRRMAIYNRFAGASA